MLETIGLTKHFKGLKAVQNVDLSVHEGEIFGVIGPNGAGKTTFFNLITGFLKPTGGRILFEGKEIAGKNPHVIARIGIVRTFQLNRIFHSFSVMDNVVASSHLQARIGFWEAALNTSGYRLKREKTWRGAMQILRFIGLADKKEMVAGNLSHGHQKLLGIAVALAARPRLLLLDEPLGGMNAMEVSRTLEIIREIRNQGIAVLLIEHNMRAVMSTCDRLLVLNFGSQIATGTPEEVQRNKDVVQAYLGTSNLSATPRR